VVNQRTGFCLRGCIRPSTAGFSKSFSLTRDGDAEVIEPAAHNHPCFLVRI
jgi:hypothetical protein